jgi:hypothetical protein
LPEKGGEVMAFDRFTILSIMATNVVFSCAKNAGIWIREEFEERGNETMMNIRKEFDEKGAGVRAQLEKEFRYKLQRKNAENLKQIFPEKE